MHQCPGGCGQQVGVTVLACQTDWRRLPTQIRHLVITAYRHGPGGTAHREAILDAVRWFGNNPRERT
jgi:hypothetical protein